MSEIHVTKEVMKAETALKRIRRNADRAIDKVTLAWMQREVDYIGELPEEVKRGLRACGVIGTEAPVFAPESEEPLGATQALS